MRAEGTALGKSPSRPSPVSTVTARLEDRAMNAEQFFQEIFLHEVNRREFIRRQLRGAMIVAARLALPAPMAGVSAPDLGIARGAPGPAARKAVELLGGIQAFVKPGQKVVIKPNMSFAHDPERGTNTHPEVVRELVAMCKEAGAGRVRVLDHPLRKQELCIEGIRKACSVFEEDMVYGLADSSFFAETAIPQEVEMKETDVMRDVLEADVLIAAPVAKTHGSAGVSLAMKMNTVIASADMVAADAQTVQMFEWYGRRFEPRQVKHIRIAHERGLGRMDVENLTIREASA
jgi:uncharacterized protein (DUF362 family)